jgi:parallel beta-helix repeat protein
MRKAICFLALCTALILMGGTHVDAATYFVSSSRGNDANDGLSPLQAWKSLDKIFQKCYSRVPLTPGDQVLLNRGDVWDGQIRFFAVGAPNSPVVLGSYGTGPAPIIYGDNHTAVWVPVSGHPGVYRASVGRGSIIGNTAYEGSTRLISSPTNQIQMCCDLNSDGKVDISDVQIAINVALGKTDCTPPYDINRDGVCNVTDIVRIVNVALGRPDSAGRQLNLAIPADLDIYLTQLTPGSFGPPTNTDTIWLRTTNGMPPRNVRVFRSAVYVARSSYVTLRDLDIRNSFHGIDVSGSSNVTITNNSIQDVLGGGIYLRSKAVNCLVQNNSITRSGNDALYVLFGSGNVFRGNVIRYVTDTVLGFPTGGDHAAIGLQESSNTIVEHNSVSFVKASGVDFYFETGSIVRYNYFFDVGAGGIYPHGTNLSVYYNVINTNWQPGLNESGHNGMHARNTGTGTILIYNNTIYGVNQFGIMGSGTGPVKVRNNIVVGTGTLLSAGPNVDSDFNCFWALGGKNFKSGSVTYANLADFTRASGRDQHSLFRDPQFAGGTRLTASDFRLAAGSPCAAAGVDMKAMRLISTGDQYVDYAGVPVPRASRPNIGAFE